VAFNLLPQTIGNWYEHFVRPTPFEVSITICKVD
jgi:hypothetical protein